MDGRSRAGGGMLWTIAGWCRTTVSYWRATTATSTWRSVLQWGQCTTFTSMSTRVLTMLTWSWRCASALVMLWDRGDIFIQWSAASIHQALIEPDYLLLTLF